MRQNTNQTKRAGYTLLELMTATAASAALVVGMASSIKIASDSLDIDSGTASERNRTVAAVDRMMSDVRHALSFTERTYRAVAFTVPDRNGDGRPESLRYAWAGSPGDQLTLEVNGAVPVALVEDVQSLNLAFLERSVEAAPILYETVTPAVWLVTADEGVLTTDEEARIAWFEGWGYPVETIADTAAQSDFDTAAESALAFYVSDEVSASDLGYKLRLVTTGVVSEQRQLDNEFGFATNNGGGDEHTSVNITDASHYITTGFSTGNVTVMNSYAGVITTSGTRAPGLQVLGTEYGGSALAVLDTDADLANSHDGNDTAAGRRARTWFGSGSHNFEPSDLNATGLVLLQRVVSWAIGEDTAEEEEIDGVAYRTFAAAEASSNAQALSVPLPANTAEGNLLVAAVALDGYHPHTLFAPAGWTEVDVAIGGNAVMTFGVWWKLADASEPSSHEFTWDSNEKAYGWIMRFTGHDPASPIAAYTTGLGADNSPVSPSVTTTADNSLVLRLGGFDDDDITPFDPGLAGHTAITMGEAGTSGSASGGAGYVIQETAGPSGTSTFELTGSGEQYRTVTIAIPPAP